jgi:hypothetical protein
MNIENIFKIETINMDDSILQKVTMLTIFHLSVFVSEQKGNHFSFAFGIGPIEMEWSVRLWLTQTK